MKIIALSLLAAFPNPLKGLHSPFATHHDVTVTQSRVAGWRIEARQDRFAGTPPVCVLRRGRVTVEGGTVIFSFPPSTDTANAQFRVDDGPTQPSSSVAVEVAGAGIQLVTQDLKNPSAGRVAIPLRLVKGANRVSIRPNMRANHQDFPLTGLSTALAQAEVRGCPTARVPAVTTP